MRTPPVWSNHPGWRLSGMGHPCPPQCWGRPLPSTCLLQPELPLWSRLSLVTQDSVVHCRASGASVPAH